jgi:cytoskeletal protein CcmA (bactofilin family)
MLGNRNKSNGAAVTETTSLIALGTRIRGDVAFSGRLHVDGSVEGALHGEGDNAVLTLSNHAQVVGEILAPHVIINGVVTGDVTATQRLELASGARVEGNVYYKVMEMSAGAEINGKIVHRADPPQQLPRPETLHDDGEHFVLAGAEAKS